jgi:N-methylhydantoinase B
MDLITFHGTHPDGRPIATIYFAAGGFGALAGHDGANTTPGPSNMGVVPVEVWESLTGTTIERKALLPDSGGPGAARGGLGQELVMRNDTGADLVVDVIGYRTDYPAEGMRGGGPGLARRTLINDEEVPRKGRFTLRPGDRLSRIEAGGGGFGPASERPPEKVAEDVRLGFVSRAAAARDYGTDIE